MANSAWQATIQDSSGNIVEGAEVQVLFESSGTPATIYSDRAGTPLVNPFLTGSTGFAQFYAPAGNYRVVATKDTFTNTWRDQRLGDSQGYDVQSSPSDATAGRILTNETTHIGGNLNYTGANYQPDVSGSGIGVVRLLKNNTGSSSDGSTTAGSNLELTYAAGSGTMVASGISPVGTWKQVAGFALSAGNFSWYVRIA